MELGPLPSGYYVWRTVARRRRGAAVRTLHRAAPPTTAASGAAAAASPASAVREDTALRDWICANGGDVNGARLLVEADGRGSVERRLVAARVRAAGGAETSLPAWRREGQQAWLAVRPLPTGPMG
jgi:hypothetical protein